jgi:hypothetical protein
MRAKTTKKIELETSNPGSASTDRKFWMVLVDLGEPKVLGKHLPPGFMVMHNHGPGGIHVKTGWPELDVILPAGDTQIARVRDQIGLAVFDKAATLEFEYSVLQK